MSSVSKECVYLDFARIMLLCSHNCLLRLQGCHSNDYEPSPASEVQGLVSHLSLRPGVPRASEASLRFFKWSSSTGRHVYKAPSLGYFVATHERIGLRKNWSILAEIIFRLPSAIGKTVIFVLLSRPQNQPLISKNVTLE